MKDPPKQAKPTLYHGNFGWHLDRPPPGRLSVRSPAFANGARIPRRHAADGENLSPPMAWSNVPEGTKSLAVLFEEAPATPGEQPRALWVVYNIPATFFSLPEGIRFSENPLEFPGVVEGKNDFGRLGYRGPLPKPGRTFRYAFRVFALDRVLNLPREATREHLIRSMKGHVLAQGQFDGTYRRRAAV